jgi:hypothetical protein
MDWRMGLEVNLFKTNPTKLDTDGDSIPDGLEATTKCLNPLVNDAMVMDMSKGLINKTGLDTDKDGKTNVQEFRDKTDPCSPSQPIHHLVAINRNVARGSAIPRDLTHSVNSTINITSTTNTSPFIISLKKTDGMDNTNDELQYNSLKGDSTSIINNTRNML